MKLAFSTLGSPKYSLDEILRTAVDNGYDGVELRAVSGTIRLTELPELSSPEVATTRRRFEDAGLAIPCVGTSVLIEFGAGDELDAQLALARDYIRIAADLESPLLRIFAGPPKGHPDPESTYPSLAQGLTRAAEAAAGSGVQLAVETHGTLSSSRALLDVFGFGVPDDVVVVWDVMHTFRSGETVEESYYRLKPLIRHLHLRDATSAIVGAHDYVPTGEGIMPFADVVGLLQRDGFDGYLSFEWEKMWVPELAEPEAVIPQYTRFMSQFRAEDATR